MEEENWGKKWPTQDVGWDVKPSLSQWVECMETFDLEKNILIVFVQWTLLLSTRQERDSMNMPTALIVSIVGIE